jgi:tetratricopeptide (TPR) repeat protein
MKLHRHLFLIAALAVPVFCQEPIPAPSIAGDDEAKARIAPPLSSDRVVDLAERAAKLAQFDASRMAGLTALADKIKTLNIDEKLSQLTAEFDSGQFDSQEAAAEKLAAQADLAFLQTPRPAPPDPPAAPLPRGKVATIFRGDSAYSAGTRALDQHKYDEAVQRFDSAIAQDPERADGALYWKAYALNREGKRDEALAALAQLRRDHASSAWLKDAQVLEAEVRQNNGQPVSPEQETNDDLKLMAINSLMNADAERAIPLVEGVLKGSAAPAVKDRALFVLSQNKSPRAQQSLTDFAKGGGNPDLQLLAIRYVGMSGTKEAQQQLVGIYASSSDSRVKNSIIQSLFVAHANDALMNVAKTEKDASLRNSAIRLLATNKGVTAEGLAELYGGADASTKREIINGLMARGDAKTLVELARKESDPAMKKTIVERLSSMHDSKDAMDYMMELLK